MGLIFKGMYNTFDWGTFVIPLSKCHNVHNLLLIILRVKISRGVYLDPTESLDRCLNTWPKKMYTVLSILSLDKRSFA